MESAEPLKILVVDDEPDLEILMRQKYRRKIKSNEIDFLFAVDGQDALDKLKDRPDLDIVITDINMPRMDGLTLLSHIPQISPVLKAIIVSAYGDMDNIRSAMNKGAFDFITKPINFQDLQQTIDKTYTYVMEQKRTIKAMHENDILKMYVDKDVIRFMTSMGLGSSILVSESIEATVVFIDICGFTAISERYEPNIVVSLLNKYFDIMVREIEAEGGLVDKFMGDCVMAVFRNDDHVKRAIDSSLVIRKIFKELKEDDLDGYDPQISIGINSGEVVSGNIGSETLRRLDYTVIGDIVNTAQRFQSAASEGQIIIGDKVHKQINGTYQCEEIGKVMLKNKAESQMIYNIREL